MKRMKVTRHREPIGSVDLIMRFLALLLTVLLGMSGYIMITHLYAPAVEKSYEDVLSKEYNLSSSSMESALNDSRGSKVAFKDVSTESDSSNDRKTIQVTQEFMEDGEVKTKTNDVVIGDKDDDGEYEIIKRGQENISLEDSERND